MEFKQPRKTPKYQELGLVFGRVRRSGKQDLPVHQQLQTFEIPQPQQGFQTYPPFFPLAQQNYDSGHNSPMYNQYNHYGPTPYDPPGPGPEWNSHYQTGYTEGYMPGYGGPPPGVFGNQFAFHGTEGHVQTPGHQMHYHQSNMGQQYHHPQFPPPQSGIAGVPPPAQVAPSFISDNNVAPHGFAEYPNPTVTDTKKPHSKNKLEPSPTPTLKIFEGLITFSCDEYGFVGPEVFFSASNVRGQMKPMEGDLVLVEAEKVEGMKFEYAAKRVQVLKVKAQLELEKKFLGKVSLPDEHAISKAPSNAPPPPILSKLKSFPRSRSRSRSREHDRRSKKSSHKGRISPKASYTRSRYSRSRSSSRERNKNGQWNSGDRKHRSRSSSSSRTRTSHRSPHTAAKKKQDPTIAIRTENSGPVDSRNLKKSPFSEFLHSVSSASAKEAVQNSNKGNNAQITVSAGQRSKKNDMVDYNVWGLPSDNLKTDDRKQTTADMVVWESGTQVKVKAPQRQVDSKAKPISIKLGFTGIKNKNETGEAKPKASSETETAKMKTKQDLFREHILNSKAYEQPNDRRTLMSDKRGSKDSRSKGSNTKDEDRLKREELERIECELRLKKLHQKQREYEERLKEIDRMQRSYPKAKSSMSNHKDRSRSRSPISSKRYKRSQPVERPSPPEFVKKQTREVTEDEKISASLHKQTRRASPQVRLVFTSTDLEELESNIKRKRTPTEGELRERKRMIEFRELQLEEESRLLHQKVATLGRVDDNDDVLSEDIGLKAISSPLIKLDSRSPSPIIVKGRNRKTGSRSPRHHRTPERHFRRSRSPRARRYSRSPVGVSSYRGKPLTLEAPVARRRADHFALSNDGKRTIDPSLVLRLGRYLRNGEEFICYVCNKKGHHGTVCWMRKPGMSYPEDDQANI